MFKVLDRTTLRERLGFRDITGDKGRTAVMEFQLPKDDTDNVIGASGSSISQAEDMLEQHIINNIDEVYDGEVDAETMRSGYRARIRIENKKGGHVTHIDERMRSMFNVQETRVHVV